MMQSGSGTSIAAVFPDEARAEACLQDLKRSGFSAPWMALTKPAAGDETAARFGTVAGSVQHEVTASSDGVFGAIGRFFSGEASLRRSLVDHGVAQSEAQAIDAAIPPDGAVVVVAVGVRGDEAAAIFAAHGADVRGATTGFGMLQDFRSRATGAGQGDVLDRGTGQAAASDGLGVGLGSSTGFLSDRAAKSDPGNDLDTDARDPDRDVFYERRT